MTSVPLEGYVTAIEAANKLLIEVRGLRDTCADLTRQKNQAYHERNLLVAALSRLFPAWISAHEPVDDLTWDHEWLSVVFIMIPTFAGPVQVSWHLHDSDLEMFDHLERRLDPCWDGHDTEEKYLRLSRLQP